MWRPLSGTATPCLILRCARGPLGLALAGAAALLCFSWALRSRPPFEVDIGAPSDSHFLRGFHAPIPDREVSFRWSGPESEIVLHGAEGGFTLRLRLKGGVARDRRVLVLRSEGPLGKTLLATLGVEPGWRVYSVPLPSRAGSWAVEPTTLALSTPEPLSGRQGPPLGVMVDWLRLKPVQDDPAPWRAVLGRSFFLVWGLAVLAALLWRLDRALFADLPRFAALRVGAPTLAAAVTLAVVSHLNPYSLAWTLPPMPWTLGLVTAGLLKRRLLPPREGDPFSARALPSIDSRARLLLAGVLVVAVGIRFYRIRDLPYGLWRDEARHGLAALRMLEDPSYHPVYVAEGGVDMPALGLWPFALAHRLFGIHAWTMRPVTALAGALTVLPLCGLVRRLTGRSDIAVLSAFLLAVSSWHVTISRFSFPAVFDPLSTLTALGLLVSGLQGEPSRLSSARLGASGILIGLGIQTYHSARAAPLVAALLAVLLLKKAARPLGEWGRALAWPAAGFLLAAWPLLAYAAARPIAFNQRVSRVFLLGNAAETGDAPLGALDSSIGRHLLMFHVHGDANGRHHAPGRPMLDVFSGIGFLAGCALLLGHSRDARALFLLGALALELLPSLLAVDGPHAMRGIGAAPFAYTVAASGWVALGSLAFAAHPPGRVGSVLLVGLASLVLNFRTYFATMPVDPLVWGSCYPVHTQIGTFIRDLADRDGPDAVRHIYVSEALAENSVFEYLARGLPVQTFEDDRPSRPPEPGALFALSGYTYREEAARLEPYLGPAPTPALTGPRFPGLAHPSYVAYRVR